MDIAQALKDFMQTHGIEEQKDLADLLETSQQNVSNWLSGKVPRGDALRRINHLLATYKQGEMPQPPVPRPVFDPAITEIHEVPVAEEAQIARYSTAKAEPGIKSEYETRRSVADALGAIAGPFGVGIAASAVPGAIVAGGVGAVAASALSSDPFERMKLIRSQRQEFEKNLGDLLDNSIEFAVDAPVDFQSLRQRADYLSPRVCAEIKIPMRSDYMIAESGVHQLLTLREILKRNNQEREYFVLILVLPPGTGMRPIAMSRIVTLASIHDVHVFITNSAEETAQILSELEKTSIEELRERHIDDLF